MRLSTLKLFINIETIPGNVITNSFKTCTKKERKTVRMTKNLIFLLLFFYRIYPFKTLAFIAHHNFLSLVPFRKCPIFTVSPESFSAIHLRKNCFSLFILLSIYFVRVTFYKPFLIMCPGILNCLFISIN